MAADQAKVGKVDLGSGKAQHVDLWRKVKLRRDLLERATWIPGPAFVPFIGEGDIAAELYSDRPLFGVELEPAVAETARRRFAGSSSGDGSVLRTTIVTGDANTWHADADPPLGFAIADVDAFSNPYPAIEAFWRNADLADQVVIFGTDGMRLAIRQSKTRTLGPLPEGKIIQADISAKRSQWNGYWPRYVRPWLEQLVAPARIVAEAKYLRSHMLYWGIVVDRRGGPAFDQAVQRAFAGSGVDVRTSFTPSDDEPPPPPADPDPCAEPSSSTLSDLEKVEAALLEAATAGNVSAAIFWLEHKGGPTWIGKENSADAKLAALTKRPDRR